MESNTRVITWSDGTKSLYIDGEVYDLAVAQGPGRMFISEYHTNVGVLEHVTAVNNEMQVHVDANKLRQNVKLNIGTVGVEVNAIASKMIAVAGDPELERQKLEKLEAQKERQRRIEQSRKARMQRVTRKTGEVDDDGEDELGHAWKTFEGKWSGKTAEGYAEDGFVVGDDEDEDEEEAEQDEVEEIEEEKTTKRKREEKRGEWKIDGQGRKRWRAAAPDRHFDQSDGSDQTAPASDEENSQRLAGKRRVMVKSDSE